jgi:cellulose synthase (UDP-forming)
LTIEFSVEASPLAGSRSTPEQAILRDSSLDLSALAHYVEMPRLDLFANSGFPFTKFADLSETAVILPHHLSNQQAGLYLALLGFFGARTGYPALRVSVLYPEQAAAAANKHLLIVGGPGEEGPARVDKYGIRISSRPDAFSFFPWRKAADQSRLAAGVLIADPSPAGFISEFASPFGRDTTAVSFQARTPSDYDNLEQFFAENKHLSDIHGNLSLLQDGQLHSFTLKAATYSYGNLRWDERWRTWAREHYWVMPLLLLLVAAILGSQLNAWLEARVRLRLECQN